MNFKSNPLVGMIDLPQYINAYGLTSFVWLLLLTLVALPNYSILTGIAGSIFLLYWVYGIHVFMHIISKVFPFNYLDPHVIIHHNPSTTIPRWLNLVIEALENFAFFYILILIQSITGIHWISTSTILLAALWYTFVHIIHFSIFGNEQHKQHHEKSFCNYNPEAIDTLLGTRCSPDTPYTNISDEIIYGLCAFPIVLFLKYWYKLD